METIIYTDGACTGNPGPGGWAAIIIVGNQNGLTHHPIPKNISNDSWKLCYSSSEVAESIKFFSNKNINLRSSLKKDAQNIRNGYFSRLTPESANNFLNII